MAVPGRPIGAILAGGAGVRIGGSKATVHLRGRPLLDYPYEAMRQVLDEVVIVAKRSTELPSLPGVPVWIEPETPQHPLAGILHALDLAEGRRVLVCATDLPFVTAAVIERLARADPGGAPAVIARGGDRSQPLLGVYDPAIVGQVALSDRPLRQVVAELGARIVEVDPCVLFNVNALDDLLQAAAMLDAAEPAPSRR